MPSRVKFQVSVICIHIYHLIYQVTGIPVVFVSALEGRGRVAVMHQLIDTYEKWCLRLPTARLNRWLRKVIYLNYVIVFSLVDFIVNCKWQKKSISLNTAHAKYGCHLSLENYSLFRSISLYFPCSSFGLVELLQKCYCVSYSKRTGGTFTNVLTNSCGCIGSRSFKLELLP